MIEDDFYATIKLKTGEEIFAKVSPCQENDRILLFIFCPVIVTEIKNVKGCVGYKVDKWLKTSDEKMMVIDMDNVLTIVESDNMEFITMHQSFENYVDIDNRKNEHQTLNRKMGFLGNVNDAKKLLEKIFNNN